MATAAANSRGSFGSRLGFILAAAGSAVGLGNIWRFPYMAADNGGGAFVLLYLLCVALIGLPVMLCELSMGRATELSPVGAFRKLAPKSMWPWVGALGVVTGFGILAFYSVVAGWTLGYLGKAVQGDFGGEVTVEQSTAMFTTMIGDPMLSSVLAGVFIALTVLVVRGGVSGGIEAASKILMPALLVLLILLVLRSVTLPGAERGIEFLLAVDFSKITGTSVMSAMGQALFSLSLGMGAMITFGSYFPKGENMPFAAIVVAFSDTFVALLAGLLIFPALFSAGAESTGGPGLVFIVLPTIFHHLPMGMMFSIAFYLLLAVAALTSTISLLEVVVSYLVDERGWKRETGVWAMGGGVTLLAIPSALSQGATPSMSDFLGTGLSFLDVQNIIWGNYSLSIGAFMICTFVGWRWGVPKALEAIEQGGFRLPLRGTFGVLTKVVCPIAVLAVLAYLVSTGRYF